MSISSRPGAILISITLAIIFFLVPMSSPLQTVAIIGGGVSGLSCASHLAKVGKFAPTVFDTGRLRPGGRCSSRLPGDKPRVKLGSGVVDHAAQVISIPEGYTEFRQQVRDWVTEGVVAPFPPNSVLSLDVKDSEVDAQPKIGFEAYYGVNGISTVPLSLSSGICVVQDCWVSPSNGVKRRGNKWVIKSKGEELGSFDKLVIAHNGKCADRLMSKTPAKKLHNLLKVNFSDKISRSGGKKMTLNSIYSLSFVVPKGSELGTKMLGHCCYVKNDKSLKFVSNNSRKLGYHDDEKEVWTILSSASFGKKFKGPQENLPEDLVRNVTELLLGSVADVFRLEEKLEVEETMLQLWGAGLPLNTWGSTEGYLYDSRNSVGCVGDWLTNPSVAGAWESGRRFAAFLNSGGGDDGSDVGLEDGLGWSFNEGVNENGIGDI